MIFRFYIALLVLITTSIRCLAQPYLSDGGKYEVDQIKGCAPLTINVTVRPPSVCNGANPCDMDFEGNANFEALQFTHTFTTPGTYRTRILFQTAGFDYITVTVLPNIQPEFDIYSCGNNSVQVKINDTNYDQYVINYNDGSPDVVVPSGSLATDNHVFAVSGSKTVSVRGRNLGAGDNCDPSVKTVDALMTLPGPTITQLQVTDAGTIQLDFNSRPNILYKLEIAPNSGTAFQVYRDIYNVTGYTAQNLQPDNAYYCFRLGAFDPCNNVTIWSNVICSADLDAAAQNNQNRLTWSTNINGITGYSISKNGSPALTASTAQAALDDPDIICGSEYCYQMTSLYTNGSSSISLEKCVTATSTDIPTTTQNISTVVTSAASVDLAWLQDPEFNAGTYNILKGGALLGTSSAQAFTDNTYAQDAAICYTINYKDVCGNQSLTSAPACPLVLAGTLQPNNHINLSWNAYTGWINGVDHYDVEKFDAQGNLLQTFSSATTTLLDDEDDPDNQTYVYRITAYAVDGGVPASISNQINIIKEPNIYHPSAFTPNGDGLNDTFHVVAQYTKSVEFKIFNRWGEMLFYTTDLGVSWDGTYKGNTVPEGTYVFQANLTDMAGRSYERSGNILVIRKRP